MIVERSHLARMVDRYDAHFVMAAVGTDIIPAKLDYSHR